MRLPWVQLMECPENNTPVTREGQLILDDTMEAVREILHCANPRIEGILPIVNLFNLRHGKAEDAIKVHEEIFENENYLRYIHSPLPDLQGHPWVWLAWTVADRASLNPRKQEIIEHVQGKHQFAIYCRQPKHQSRKHLYAYHPNPRIKEDRERYFVEMVGMMKGYYQEKSQGR
ncbi:DUF1643 domain-containing protein [Ammoniphilus sp. CFH 90114]|uniref:DUF1643 domain-containing protein n=1 Tax=Ammoniphilus sp. CFH 90114 TaxID=2493665 RepID=UPI00100DB164|nr:DUF1643 domain-containing protein [Ammoniphilus sp. CFH 90114]RXT07779.1 DUF1643 domain-containing protein [Ammoniphilus sp. CFH 90114]